MDPVVRPFVQHLEKLHDDVFAAVEPLGDREVNWTHPQLSNSIGILLRHIAGSERSWIIETVGGRKIARNREAEFGHERISKEAVMADLRRAYEDVKAVVETLTATDLAREVEVSFRGERRKFVVGWALLHSLQHTSYHLGQIQLFTKMAAGAPG